MITEQEYNDVISYVTRQLLNRYLIEWDDVNVGSVKGIHESDLRAVGNSLLTYNHYKKVVEAENQNEE